MVRFGDADGRAVDDLVFPGDAVDAADVIRTFSGFLGHRADADVEVWPNFWKPKSAVSLLIREM